jgi:hypothetical protein
MELFAGLPRAYGRYVIDPGAEVGADGKLLGRIRDTIPEPLTLQQWDKHLKAGSTFGLGVVPIRDDATVRFGAIDVDVYPIDLVKLEALSRAYGLPLVLCRTKSGGAHLYLFMSEDAPAKLVRGKLFEWAVALGYPGVEIFPKQISLAGEKDTGNWINMPYQGGEQTTRYALKPNGKAATIDEFFGLVDERFANVTWLESYELPKEAKAEEAWFESPPCLETLSRKGFNQGSRNNALFSIAVYLKKRFGDDWPAKLDEYNERFLVPPLPLSEVADVKRSLGKKAYSYKCKDEPICGVCSKQVCRTRKFGVGRGITNTDPGVDFGALVKLETDPPTWIWDVDGARLELDTEQLMDQKAFGKLVVSKLNKWPQQVKGDTWLEIVRDRLSKVEVQAVPEDATQEGQWAEHLAAFCTSRVKGRSIDELLIGKPFTGTLNGHDSARTYFKSSDFISYLQQHRVQNVSERKLYTWLLREELQTHDMKLKGKTVTCWSVPPFPEQTEAHDVPKRPVDEM